MTFAGLSQASDRGIISDPRDEKGRMPTSSQLPPSMTYLSAFAEIPLSKGLLDASVDRSIFTVFPTVILT